MGEYSYYPGLDQLHAFYSWGDSSGGRYAHQDVLGNVRGLTDAGGTVARTYRYDEFGRLVGGDSSGADYNRARWKGTLEFEPQVGLYYMRNRWYETSTGRFLSEDPIGLEGGINLYVFAGSDPVNTWDPYGLDADLPVCAASRSRKGSSRVQLPRWDSLSMGHSMISVGGSRE